MITMQGLRMPKLGFGTYRMVGAECQAAVESALGIGYRHIDTAQMYGNEAEVGAALANSGVPRDEIHLTTKVWWQSLAPAAMRDAMSASLEKLRTDHVDLYMIHWPHPDMDLPAALGQMIRFQQEGRARHLGVCNFPTALLRQAVEEIGAPIVVDQVEYHVLRDQSAVLDFARIHEMAVVAHVPLAQGRLADNPTLIEIGRKHGATSAQVALRWLLDQDNVGVIPKAKSARNQIENFAALKVTLDDTDRAAIASLPKDQRFVNPGFHPAWD